MATPGTAGLPGLPAASGTVRSLQIRNEISSFGGSDSMSTSVHSRTVMDFRLERQDGVGGVLAVRLAGYSLTGTIAEGDLVDVEGEFEHGTLVARRILNRTTGAVVEEPHRAARKACGVAFLVIFLVILAIVLTIFYAVFTGFRDNAGLGAPPPVDLIGRAVR